MDKDEVRAMLDRVASGELPTSDGAATPWSTVRSPSTDGQAAGFADLGFARLDTHRALRTGDPEVIYGAGKTPAEVVALLRALHAAPGDRPAVATRLHDDAMPAVREELPDAVDRRACPLCARSATLPATRGTVCVVTAGTSDAPVAAEAAFVARAFGAEVDRINDVGVAGLHRLLAVRDRLEQADCLVVVAGMEGALPSAIGGLVGAPIVAVPTSVGYGAAFDGLAALLGMLDVLRAGGHRRQHRQRVRRRPVRRPGRPADGTAGAAVIGWWHCSAGASGDMMLGALVDAGVPLATLQAAVDAIRTRAGHPCRPSRSSGTASAATLGHASTLRPRPRDRILGRHPRRCSRPRALADPVRALALDVFARLAAAEAGVHRTPPSTTCTSTRSAGWTRSPTSSAPARASSALGLDRHHARPR